MDAVKAVTGSGGGNSHKHVFTRPKDVHAAYSKIALVVVATWLGVLFLRALQAQLVAPCVPNESLSEKHCETQRRQNTITAAILSSIRFIVFVVAFVLSLHYAGVRTSVLFTLTGIMSLVLGLAAQSTLRDFFSGAVFLLEQQFAVGDFVHVVVNGSDSSKPISGTVDDLTIRRLKLRNFENEVIYISNGSIVTVRNASKLYPLVRVVTEVPRTAKIGEISAIIEKACKDLGEDETFVKVYPDQSPENRLRLTRNLDAAGMPSVLPQFMGVAETSNTHYSIMIRFMTDVGKQFNAGRFARTYLLERLQKESHAHAITVVRFDNTPPGAE